jgi:transcriptional regulator with XRE-family HTH domain
MSQSRLARKSDLSRGSIANIEMGRQQVPLHTLARIAAALEIDLAALLVERAEASPETPEETREYRNVAAPARAFIAETRKELRTDEAEEAAHDDRSKASQQVHRRLGRRSKKRSEGRRPPN